MTGRMVRHKMHPYRVLALMLYGRYPWLRWRGLSFDIDTPPLCRIMRVPKEKVREYFLYLREHQYLSWVDFSRGKIHGRLTMPRALAVAARNTKDDNQAVPNQCNLP